MTLYMHPRLAPGNKGDACGAYAVASAEYTAREARVLVTPRAHAAIYEIDVPRSAARVEIRRGGARMFLKHGADVSGAMRFPLRSM